jgi:hypothetical protein
MSRVTIATWGVLAVAVTAPARAEPSGVRSGNAASREPLVELGAGVFARYDLAHLCEHDLGAVTCPTNRVFAGPELAPRVRLSSVVSLGILGGFAWKLGSEDGASSDGSRTERSITTYHVDAEARFHLLEPGDPDLWLGVALGVTAIHDAWESYASNGELIGGSSSADVGPIGGVALGVDFRAAQFLALGPELRIGVLGYDPMQYFAALAVMGTFLADP